MAAIVGNYTGGKGYINDFFLTYLFSDGAWITPWGFLTALSTFELLSGMALLAGLLVRPLALVYAFLLWTFVFSLPVVTTPGVDPSVATYTSPAMFVQIRDIALSGFMFVLLMMGSGSYSLDSKLLSNGVNSDNVNWDNLGLLLRLSLAAPLIIGGLFGNFANISTYATAQPILFALGVLLVLGVQVRAAAGATFVVMLWFIATKVSPDKTLIANLNGFKREFAMLAVSAILAARGAGNAYTPADLKRRVRYSLGKDALPTA
jgi:uncharacterized membrane protein YphA (DoxX/SURF4 family)